MMGSRTARLLRRERAMMTLSHAIDLFVVTKQSEGKSPKTVSWYLNLLSRFADFVNDGDEVKLKDISVQHGRDFVSFLRAKTTRYDHHPFTDQKQGGLAPRTIHAYVRALKAFGTWLYEDGLTSRDPFRHLKRPKLPEPVIKILSEQEIRTLDECINPNCFLGARLHAIVLLLLDTGIRAGELCSLTVENSLIDENKIIVWGNGSKERIVPFANGTKRALIRYLNTWRPEPVDDSADTFILSVNGSSLTYDGLAQCIKKLGVRAGIPRLHPHLFRHTFAVNYLMNGGDVMSLKRILGHSTLDVTQMYIHLAESHIQVQHHKYSPVDRLGLGRGRRKRR